MRQKGTLYENNSKRDNADVIAIEILIIALYMTRNVEEGFYVQRLELNFSFTFLNSQHVVLI